MRRTPIIIDPGHGGSYNVGRSTAYGACAAGLTEKDITLELARRVQQHLGSEALLTREGDSNLSLAERAAFAHRYGARTLVSIHASSDSTSGVHGSEVWVHPASHAGSHQLAAVIGEELGRVGTYRGVFEGPMALLSPQTIGSVSSCLVEVDNLGDDRGVARLSDPGELDRLGSAIAAGISRFGSGGFSRDWSRESESTRIRHIMNLLINTYGYSENAAAGIVGNLIAESGVIPTRVEGSDSATPMRSQGFDGVTHDWTVEQIMNRNSSTRTGPRLPGAGLAQWTSANRRRGLFAHEWEGVVLGANILYSIDAQISYLVHELTHDYSAVNAVLTRAGVSVNDAADEVVYRFETPGSVLDDQRRLRPRTDPQVVRVFERRRNNAQRALQVWRSQGAQAQGYEQAPYV